VDEVVRPVVASLQGVIQTTGISSIPHLGLAPVAAAAPGEREAEMLKIQYKEYGQRILAAEIRPLLSKAELCDTVLVCRDGKLVTSSLLLAGLSTLLRSSLEAVPRIDAYKTVILPEEVSISQVVLLTKLMVEEAGDSPSLARDQLEQVSQLASILGCEGLLPPPAPAVPPHAPGRGTKRAAPPTAPSGTPSPRKRPAKAARVAGAPPAVKLEKTDLNADYIDEGGLVRLSSVDEMAVHYCLLCDRKFKKYNQAITHYDCAHNLAAALACDQCDETFRDMYSCVKHKHEFHGQFDANFQCYICKEVLYSRFRLGTHMKECHKQFFGEFVCRSCGMKFSAQYYLNKHLKETHTDSANTCNICQKSFSGRRYLTMHIKASHESGAATVAGGGEAVACKECDKGFSSARDQAYHASKVHGAPRPEGAFEDCGLCDKWFKTKGELGQHMSRVHQEKPAWQQAAQATKTESS